jgi:hypothetical protein
MIKTFIFVEDGSVDLDELKSSVGDDVLVISYRQGATPPAIQQPCEPVSQWNDKSYSETKKVLEKILYGNYKMSKKLCGELELLYVDYYV